MLDGDNRAAMDQGIAQITETFPVLWHGLYMGCIEQGFTEQQALALVCQYIAATHKGT